MEEDTFRSISRSFFRLVLDSEWIMSRLILEATEDQVGSGDSYCPALLDTWALILHTRRLPEACQSFGMGRPVWGQVPAFHSRCWACSVKDPKDSACPRLTPFKVQQLRNQRTVLGSMDPGLRQPGLLS